MSEVTLFETKDGSSSLLHTELNETYHSTHGALQESVYVFIDRGFTEALNQGKKQISILEIGFGTGLNALLTLLEAQRIQVNVAYETLEAYPLPSEIVNKLNYVKLLEAKEGTNVLPLFDSLHSASWNEPNHVQPNFTLLKRKEDLLKATFEKEKFDLVYYDAFAPDKQPHLWEFPILEKVVSALKPGGIFVTYSAKGQLRRDLIALGLTVKKLPGPPGKREMIQAIKLV
ncbi:MAG: tRNA (5-methylaminomethyl-2-thiouridine)(34)-methyltransferase MnmD [Cyclobacteriaceae bacterium]|jgi:tRNA U34 5-methylaminomethyl-2-thiouridine-forming methyltransferase MnmC|nr:tRNA (5-methylaminomethyl-2-thiouridine)(34)-methyltransferase MnmD [Flammeovirgaceae bacterium]